MLNQAGTDINWTRTEKSDDGDVTLKFSDPAASEVAKEKADQMNKAFADFVLTNSEVGKLVEKTFNDRWRLSVRTKFPEPTWRRLPGMIESYVDKNGVVQEFRMYIHQVVAVARAMRNSMMFAHGVGFGKTYEMIATATELR